jgi:STE24 endopeptidase
VLELALELAAATLNLRALGAGLPPELRALYDAERWRRAQGYTRARIRFAMVAAVFDLALPSASGSPAASRRWTVGSAVSAPDPSSGLLFLGALGAGSTAVHLPFRWWSTFVIEERFGFNRTSRWTFWSDVGRGALLAALLSAARSGGPLALPACRRPRLALVLDGRHGVGRRPQFVAPTWIMPLFNRFAPLADGRLRDAILAYAGRVGFRWRTSS